MRDALFIQSSLFHDEVKELQWIRSHLANYSERWLAWFDRTYQNFPQLFWFGDRALFSMANAVLLEVFANDIRAIKTFNLILLASSGVVLAIIVFIEFGVAAVALFLVLSFLMLRNATVGAVLTEPYLVFVLAILPALAWHTVRKRYSAASAIPLLIAASLAPLLKASVWPVAAICAVLASFAVAQTVKRRGLRAVLILLLVLTSTYIVPKAGLSLIHQTIGAPAAAFVGSNAGYGLWMGSLPTEWTGAYAGRISTWTFRNQSHESFLNQWRSLKEKADHHNPRILFYLVPVTDTLDSVFKNYVSYPLDSFYRIMYRFSSMLQFQGFASAHSLLIFIGLVIACGLTALPRFQGLLPVSGTVLIIAGMHSITRYRERDEMQLALLIALLLTLAVFGSIWLLRNNEKQSRSALTLAAVISAPLIVAALTLRVHSNAPPVLQSVEVKKADGRHYLSLQFDQPHIFVSLRPKPDGAPIALQANIRGFTTIAIPENVQSIAVRAWAFTGQVLAFDMTLSR